MINFCNRAVILIVAIVATAWVAKVNHKTDFIKEIRDEIKEIRAEINGIFRRLSPAVVISESPLKLSALGKQIAEDINVQDWIDKIKLDTKDMVSEENIDAYEVQKKCFEYANEDLLADVMEIDVSLGKRMKDSAYNHGLEIGHVQKVVAVVLRDKILKELGLTLKDSSK